MNVYELGQAVQHLTSTRAASRLRRTARCRKHGHAAGHTCLPAFDGLDRSALIKELSRLRGSPQRLVVDGEPVPLPPWHSGRAMLELFGEHLDQLSAWPYNCWWIGCGVIGERTVVFVARREALPPDALPADASPVERLVALTDRQADSPLEADWPSVERRLGLPLPADYKELAEAFGPGFFGYDLWWSWFRIHVPRPDPAFGSLDLGRHAEWLSAFVALHDPARYQPFGVFPAPGGLFPWATTERGHRFYWLTEGRDPDRWPTIAHNRELDEWHRFDGSTADCVLGLLTDPDQGFSEAASIDRPWFGAGRS